MKKSLVVVCFAGCIALALAGCASNSASSAASASSSESPEASASSSESGLVGMANPWSDVASADEAAAGANVGSFAIPLGSEISLGTIDEQHALFRCMDGLAEAQVDFPAVQMTIRKGLATEATNGDISGDYNTYAKTWTATIGGQEVSCSGNREGDATKTVWTAGDYCYSVTALGLGGDTDFGLSADDLEVVVAGTK